MAFEKNLFSENKQGKIVKKDSLNENKKKPMQRLNLSYLEANDIHSRVTVSVSKSSRAKLNVLKKLFGCKTVDEVLQQIITNFVESFPEEEAKIIEEQFKLQ